jgi:radical SAM protein with 4Fe4S-binding SPASM domain
MIETRKAKMFDIDYFMNINEIRKKIYNGEHFEKKYLLNKFEEYRSKIPIIYNIETTNACNMKCKMCPRTTMMTRKVETMKKDTFINIVEQIEPFPESKWTKWENFIGREYGIKSDDISENHFFTFIIPKVLQLHGYGDPLLDKNMPEYIRILSERNIPSYFSCNPANIDIKKTLEIFENGLDYIKYSIESVDDKRHKDIRGEASNFSDSYNKILELLKIKEKKGYKTTIIITMLNLNRSDQIEDFELLREKFAGQNVYVYLKSEDQQWYRQDYHGTSSIHWSEFCKHPWMSMTIKSNGDAVMCMEDFNNEIILGNVKKQSLYEIWNGEAYKMFREDHFNLTKGIKCTEQCDMKLIGSFIQ